MGFSHQRHVASPTGATLNLFVKKTPYPARAAIQISHGLAEHAGRYARFAAFMAGHSCHVYAHDHRGHGATRADDASPGQFARTDGAGKVVADMLAIHDTIKADHPGLPIVVFGHSMGGLIAMNFVQNHPHDLRAAAIWNASFLPRLPARLAQALLLWERLRLGSDMPSRIMPRLTFQDWAASISGRRTAFDWLSRDAAEVDKYITDPLCGWNATVSMWRDILHLALQGGNDRRLATIPRDMPFNLIGGKNDPATNGGKAVEALAARMRTLGFSNLNSMIYPETRHESLNDLNRNIIMEDFARWVTTVAQGR